MNTKSLLLALVALVAASEAVSQEQLTGSFPMNYTTTEVLDPQAAMALEKYIGVDESLQWQVYVPYEYDPRRPAGLLIFLDSRGWGGIPDAWRQIVSDHNLIWVGPKQNERAPSEEKRIWSAILGYRALEQQYALDLNRIYVAGLGYQASVALNTSLLANEIRGVIYMRGSAMWTTIGEDSLSALARKRHVFITGTNDKQKAGIQRHARDYERAGIPNVELIFATRNLGDPPQAEYLDQAIRYLDGSQARQ